MTDYHVITPVAAELVMQVIDGQVFIVPPAALVRTPAAAPAAGPAPSPQPPSAPR